MSGVRVHSLYRRIRILRPVPKEDVTRNSSIGAADVSGRQGPLSGHALELDRKFSGWMQSSLPSLGAYAQHCISRVRVGHHDAEDILQECLGIAWCKRDRLGFPDQDAFSYWMRRVISNRVIGLSRRGDARLCGSGGNPHGEIEGESTFDAKFHRDPLAPGEIGTGWAFARLRSLPFDEHLCLVLYEFLGLDWSMVAKVLKRSVGGAKALRQRARSRLG